MKAISLCHNVTPVLETGENGGENEAVFLNESDDENTVIFQQGSGERRTTVSYQASSPDEVSLHGNHCDSDKMM